MNDIRRKYVTKPLSKGISLAVFFKSYCITIKINLSCAKPAYYFPKAARSRNTGKSERVVTLGIEPFVTLGEISCEIIVVTSNVLPVLCSCTSQVHVCLQKHTCIYINIRVHEKSSMRAKRKKVQTLDSCFGLLALTSRVQHNLSLALAAGLRHVYVHVYTQRQPVQKGIPWMWLISSCILPSHLKFFQQSLPTIHSIPVKLKRDWACETRQILTAISICTTDTCVMCYLLAPSYSQWPAIHVYTCTCRYT